MKKQQIPPSKKTDQPKSSSYKFVSKIGGDTAALKKKADSLGLSMSKVQDALRKRIESKKQSIDSAASKNNTKKLK